MSLPTGTPLQRERAAKAQRARELYEGGMSFADVGKRLGMHEVNARRLAKRAGAMMRKRWDPDNGVKGGEKQCPICEKWKPVKEFYQRSDGKPYSYCKPCDKARAVETSKRSRDAQRRAKETRARERRRHNSQTRKLLLDAMRVIAEEYPEHEMVHEIEAHMRVGRRLFGDEGG